VEHLPVLLEARRRLAGELLAAAAVHSAICDEIGELEARPGGPTAEEQERLRILRERRLDARRRHDIVDRRLRRLVTELHSRAHVTRS
jgi:hypothetical protein